MEPGSKEAKSGISLLHHHKQNTAKFAALTAPHQFALGIPGGMDIIIHSTMLAMNRHIARTTEDFRRRNLPTRVQVLLDLEKMFTRVSRRRIHDVLAEKLPHLLHGLPCATCWFRAQRR